MAPTRTKNRASGVSPAPAMREQQLIPTKMGTPTRRSPIKKPKAITLEQKQAIIDNLQLEITDRARRLRAQYHARAQSLRSRVEMRVNRIPRSMLKMTMEELVAKCVEQQKRTAAASRPPPVPEKDYHTRAGPAKAAHTSRDSPKPRKRPSDEMTGDGNKENHVADVENPKKRHRGVVAATAAPTAAQVLSPTSTNTRNWPRERQPSPGKPLATAHPASPTKARPGLASATRPAPVRKATTSSMASSAVGSTTANARTRRAAAPVASKVPASRPATRAGRRVSESSDASTSTVVKKTTTTAKATSASEKKRTVMGTIRKGVTGGTAKKASAATASAAAKAVAASTASTAGSGRVLRKRG